MFIKTLVAAASLSLAAASAHAVTITAGDDDCFGLGGSCAVGDNFRDDLGGSFFTDYSDAGDPLGTDVWDSGPVNLTFNLGAAVSGATSASLGIFYAGLELATGGDVQINGTSVGSLQTFGTSAFQVVDLTTFLGVHGLLTPTSIVSIIPSSSGDGYIVDYASITYETDVSAVPLPAGLPLLLVALGTFGIARRRRS